MNPSYQAKDCSAILDSPSLHSHYDDWVCLLCQNHNYSFRQTCNRCRNQSKSNNAYMLQLYHEQMMEAMRQEQQPNISPDTFPNVLLLMISEEEWEETISMREHHDAASIKWINNLIEE